MLVFVLFENINIKLKFRKFLKVTFLNRNYQFMSNLNINIKKKREQKKSMENCLRKLCDFNFK